jgi:ABC-type cobalamin/Fe3+-siderophores transport system ATPase subunit
LEGRHVVDLRFFSSGSFYGALFNVVHYFPVFSHYIPTFDTFLLFFFQFALPLELLSSSDLSPHVVAHTHKLKSILGTKSLALVPQEAIVISGTIKENITMGRPFIASKFTWAVEQSCMDSDLQMFTHQEETLVGEKGTTLSGGQQQRLSIARALYGKPTLLVADDPIAAVDAVVGSKIFATLKAWVGGNGGDDADSRNGSGSGGVGSNVNGLNTNNNNNKCKPAVLMVLNQLHLLPQCDSVVFMHEGAALASGSYEELLDSCPVFADYVSSYQKQEKGTADGAENEEEGGEGGRGATGEIKVEDGVEASDTSFPPFSLRTPKNVTVSSAIKTTTIKNLFGEPTDTEHTDKQSNDNNDNNNLLSKADSASSSQQAPSQLISKEVSVKGVVQLEVLFKYLRSGGWSRFAACFGFLCLSFASLGLNDLWLAHWTSLVDEGKVEAGSW